MSRASTHGSLSPPVSSMLAYNVHSNVRMCLFSIKSIVHNSYDIEIDNYIILNALQKILFPRIFCFYPFSWTKNVSNLVLTKYIR